MPLYEYHCPDCGASFDYRARYEDETWPCACGAVATRNPVNLTAIVGATVMRPTKYRVSEFQEASAEVDYAYTKAESEGQPVKRPDLWKAAKKEARKRGAPIR